MTLEFLNQFDFFAGVPDSRLKSLCAYLYDKYGISENHIITANEGNAVAIAAGYYLSTGKTPVVYLQNSGIGNIINPAASLLHKNVYGIPCLFIIGWRGEPGLKDEPQHIFQGAVTLELLKEMQIAFFVIDQSTSEEEVYAKLQEYQTLFEAGKQAAFVIRAGAFEYKAQTHMAKFNDMTREEVIDHILEKAEKDDVFISTTGMASRELFELREARGESHASDFLTVGSMGHASSVALGIALRKKGRRVWCIDGDGSTLMHMGSMAVIGANAPENLIHVMINNGAHESVGGMPTVAGNMDWLAIAAGCGYANAVCASDISQLDEKLESLIIRKELGFLEVRTAPGFRKDLGRPTLSPDDNKRLFMKFLDEANEIGKL